jgi:Cu(I)/Ag(I) efflux system membrane fusion protein
MVPGQKFDKPGKSPFMDMQLVPKYADEAGDEGKISISPRVVQNLGVRTAEVIKGSIAQKLQAVGNVAFNERNLVVVQARVTGFVEKLYARAPLDPVRKGQPLADILAPEWIAAQEEYLALRRMQAPGIEDLRSAARQRLIVAGMTTEQIRLVERTGTVQAQVTLRSPATGVIAELGAREGMTVMAGTTLFRINALASVWVNAEVPEAQAAEIRPGTPVEARTPAHPGTVFKGQVNAILPEINPATRTIKARIELSNPEERLAPGMFASLDFAPSVKKDTLLVATEAVIHTGTRSVVMVAQGDGKFEPKDVELGRVAGGQTEILKGLQAGQKVVISGQFLIDSEANLAASTMRMEGPPSAETAPAPPTAGEIHHAEGKVEHIEKDAVTISHGPVPSLKWGPMTMNFKLPREGLPARIQVGDPVRFEFQATSQKEFQIIKIDAQKTATGQDASGAMRPGAKP